MHKKYLTSFTLTVSLLSTIILTGCLEEYIHPQAKCTDAKVITKLNELVNASTLYGSKAKVNEELIVLVGINEKTKMKQCKAKVDYVLKNEDNSSMVNMMNNIPFMSNISKNIDLTYTITPTEDKKDFIIKIID